MTQRQTNVLNMYKGVLKYLKARADVWSGIPPVAEKQFELISTMAQIQEKLFEQQQKNPLAYTQAKHAAFSAMTRLAYKMALRVKAYAKKSGHLVLLHTVDFSESSLERGPETEVINRCSLIASAAEEHLAHLSVYKVSEADVAVLKKAIETALPKTAERDAVSGERIGITAAIPQLFSQAQEQISDLDDLIEGLVDEEHDDFITGYFVLRRINNRRTGQNRKEEALADEPVR